MLLDGGVDAWTEAGHALTSEVGAVTPGSLTVNLRPEVIADQAEVLAAIEDDSVELVDALPTPIYNGEMALYARPGHIASAVNVCPAFVGIRHPVAVTTTRPRVDSATIPRKCLA